MYLEEQNSLFEAHGAVPFAWVDLVGFICMDFLCCGILSTRSGADFVLRDGKINKSCLFGKVGGVNFLYLAILLSYVTLRTLWRI